MSRCPNPSCGSDRAYIGLSTVECPVVACRHFSPKLQAELQPVARHLATKDRVGVTVAPLGTTLTPKELDQIYLDYKAWLSPVPIMTTAPVVTPEKSVLIPDLSDARRKYAATKGIVLNETMAALTSAADELRTLAERCWPEIFELPNIQLTKLLATIDPFAYTVTVHNTAPDPTEPCDSITILAKDLP